MVRVSLSRPTNIFLLVSGSLKNVNNDILSLWLILDSLYLRVWYFDVTPSTVYEMLLAQDITLVLVFFISHESESFGLIGSVTFDLKKTRVYKSNPLSSSLIHVIFSTHTHKSIRITIGHININDNNIFGFIKTFIF